MNDFQSEFSIVLNQVYNEVKSEQGKKIRYARLRNRISLRTLAKRCKWTHGALGNYESGIRQVGDDKLKILAEALEVSEAYLKERKLDTYLDVIHTLFELQRLCLLEPTEVEGDILLRSQDPVLQQLLNLWFDKFLAHKECRISDTEYETWTMQFPDGEDYGWVDSSEIPATKASIQAAVETPTQAHRYRNFDGSKEDLAASIALRDDDRDTLEILDYDSFTDDTDTVE